MIGQLSCQPFCHSASRMQEREDESTTPADKEEEKRQFHILMSVDKRVWLNSTTQKG